MRQNAEVPASKFKAPYSPPRLISYGDLPHMTLHMLSGKTSVDNAKTGRKT
jgi:hypothetical protein